MPAAVARWLVVGILVSLSAPVSPAAAQDQRAPAIQASPNPVPLNAVTNTTLITWESGSPASAVVTVSQDGQQEKEFARGAAGSSQAPWIVQGSTYEFRLYTDEAPRRLLASVTVTGAPATAQNVAGTINIRHAV